MGGAVSGSAGAEILADNGIHVAVFDQNARPYSKIEDGLPRWHVEQRRQKYARIDAPVNKPNLYFIPSAKLGRDFDLAQLFQWGFSAVILANGATANWAYRKPNNMSARASFIRSFFIYWYHHQNEKDYRGPR